MVEQRLPGDMPCFVGRAEQLAELEATIRAAAPDERCTVVVSAAGGVCGVGTSAFAIHLAHRVKDHFPGGQLYVDLHGAEGLRPEPAVVVEALLRALEPTGELPRGLAERIERLGALLRERRILLVLDEADERQLAAWLPSGAAGGMLIASRERCDELKPTAACELAPLPQPDAIELLGRVAGREIAPADAHACEVVGHCGGLPLALRLAGGALAARADWSVTTLAERLERARRDVGKTGSGNPEVRAGFAVRYTLLADTRRALVRRLGALPVLESGHAVIGPAIGVPEAAEAIVPLQELVDAQLLALPLPDRYRLHPLVWTLARERLAAELPDASAEQVRTVVFDTYQKLARRTFEALAPPEARSETDERRMTRRAALLLGDREADGAIMAVRVAHRDRAWRTAIEIAFGLKGYLLARRRHVAWVAVQRLAVDAARAMGAAEAELTLLEELGRGHVGAGELDEAVEALEHVVELARVAGDARVATSARAALGEAHRRRGDADTAERLLREVLDATRRGDEDLSRLHALRSLADLYRSQDRFAMAVEPLQELARLLARRGDAFAEARTRLDLGWALRESGQPADGEHEWRLALPELRRSAPAVAHRLAQHMEDPGPPEPEPDDAHLFGFGDDPPPFERALYAAYGSAAADAGDELAPTLMRQVAMLRAAGRLLSCDFDAFCRTEQDGILRLMLFAESLYLHLHATVTTAAVLVGRRAVPPLSVRGLAQLQRVLADRPDHPLAPRLLAVEREMTLLRWLCAVRNKALAHRAEGDYTAGDASMLGQAFIMKPRRRSVPAPALQQVEDTFAEMRRRHAAFRAMASELVLQRGRDYGHAVTAGFDAASHELFASAPLDFDACRRAVAAAELHDLVVSPSMLENADAALATLIELIPLAGGRAAG